MNRQYKNRIKKTHKIYKFKTISEPELVIDCLHKKWLRMIDYCKEDDGPSIDIKWLNYFEFQKWAEKFNYADSFLKKVDGHYSPSTCFLVNKANLKAFKVAWDKSIIEWDTEIDWKP